MVDDLVPDDEPASRSAGGFLVGHHLEGLQGRRRVQQDVPLDRFVWVGAENDQGVGRCVGVAGRPQADRSYHVAGQFAKPVIGGLRVPGLKNAQV
jgi:hypothetical protein